MEEIHRILETIQRIDQKSVLATITHVEGRAYRKEGTTMLFLEDGSHIGVLSAGCLETHLSACVPDILAAESSQSFIFDMSSPDPLSFGEDSGCGSVIHVTMEAVHDRLKNHLLTLKKHLDHQTEVIHVKRFDVDGSVSDYAFLTKDQLLFGEWAGEFPQAFRDGTLSEEARRSGVKLVPSIQSDVFLHTYYPKPRLLLFGAGPDARSLASFAAATGFSVVVSDWRAALCNRRYFPDADSILLGFPEETINMIHFTPSDYAVVMTHHFKRDQELVRFLSKQQLCYLGILGSKNRTARLFHGKRIPNEVYSPVGLAIGAEGPEEIAVSILAEMIYMYRKNRAGSASCHD